MTSPRRRQIVAELCADFDVSQRRACRALALDRSGLRYTPVRCEERVGLARRIEELAGLHPRYGYRRIWALLRREGWSSNGRGVHPPGKGRGWRWAGPRASPGPRGPTGGAD